jgi:hypothetical protein
MQLPTTTYRHGCDQGRRGNNASVSPYCFTAHPAMGGENRHCAHLTVHCTSPVTLEGGYDRIRTPQSRGFGLIRSVLTRPRPGLDAQYGSTGKEGRYGTALRVISASHPLRHHDVQGWSFIPRARRYSHLNRGRQNITSRLPGLLLPYKRAGRGSTTRERRLETLDLSQVPAIQSPQRRDQHLKQSPLYFFFSL